MPQALDTITRRDDLPLAGRTMELRGFTRAAEEGASQADTPLATAQLVFAAGASVRRYDWYRERSYLEQLVVEEGAIRLDRLTRGAPLLNTHNAWSLEAQLGVVENPSIDAGAGLCDVTFSRRESVAGYVQDVADGIIRNVSVGYVRHRVEMVPPEADDGEWLYRVIDWEPYEVSLVPIPADMDCQVRGTEAQPPAGADAAQRMFPCEFIEVRSRPESPTVGASAAISTLKEPSMPQPTVGGAAATTEQNRSAPSGAQDAPAATANAAADAAATAAAQRAADISEVCARHNVAHLAAGLIRGGQSVEHARAAVLEELALRDAASGGHRNVRIETVRDEMATRLAGLEQAIMHRVAAGTQLDDNGRQYRGMSLLEMGRDLLEAHGVKTRGMERMQLATAILTFRSGGMHTTSDFSSVLANVANKRLRGVYDENPGTYGLWARRAPNAPDFKNINVVQLSGAPELLRTNEHGEFKYGTMKDGAETYGIVTHGRIVTLSRQAMVNDDLRAFDRMISGFGGSARRLENRLVYAQLTGNPTMGDGEELFSEEHKNVSTGAPSALQFSALSAGRTAMRLQRGLQNEELNLAPSYLIVPAALEQTAYQLTSSNYTPAKQADVNEFRAGGRTSLEPIVEPILDAVSASAWYLAAANSQVDTVEYTFLDGAEGPVIESEIGFEIDGVSYKCRHDFAAKVVDHRGLHRADGR
ncbi:prohead protease/major capsid protein fusion protein [uncultured Variovorax sp.]|uniref:prohead protease/major capsid protein fusion protein n=1 Tax=uncultured Variovorax sp. TaxID=114708 RepID=UPI0025DCF244|nr:prohead protease/major capsid protein fusion protein [uncultured Variovorax sp.]